MKLFQKKSDLEKALPWMDVSEASTTAAVYMCISPSTPLIFGKSDVLEKLSRFARSLGLSIGEDFIFFDHCDGGTPFTDRPGYLQMLRACRESDRPFDLILVNHPFHLTRSPDDLVFMYSLFLAHCGTAFLFREDMSESRRLYELDHSYADPLYTTGERFGFCHPDAAPTRLRGHMHV